VFGNHAPGRRSIWDEFRGNRAAFGFDREIAARTGQQLGAQLLQEGIGSLRGAIGTPAQLRALIRGYEDAGVDQLVFVSQGGRTRHEHICESLELFASEVMPEFAERGAERERSRADRLGPAIRAALERREPARRAPEGYSFGAAASL
jgi:alkanesulfonate monooxygenase SsuD/methylene tetrahydromethanopterin reductase-like flavin-dependent oxidoreductase (luciferase family)